jgi:hypothetical protein
MTERRRLPNRRPVETRSISAGGLNYTFSVGRFSDGTLAEVFISDGKVSSHADTAARTSAICASLALQFGCPLEVLRGALLRDSQGRASEVLGTALDAIAERQ